MWTILILFSLSCGGSVVEIPGFTTKDKCEDAVPNVRAGFTLSNPLVICVQK